MNMELLKVVIVTLVLCSSQKLTASNVTTLQEESTTLLPVATTVQVQHLTESNTKTQAALPATTTQGQARSSEDQDALPETTTVVGDTVTQGQARSSEGQDSKNDDAPSATTTVVSDDVSQGHARLSEGQDPNNDLLLLKVSTKEDVEDDVVSKDGNVLIKVVENDEGSDIIRDVRVYGEKVYEGPVCHENVSPAEEGELEVSGTPVMGSCNAKAWSWTLDVGEGYRTDVTLHSLNVNQKAGEFLIIGAGSSMDDLWEDQNNPVFTAAINSPKTLRVLTTTGVFSVMLVTNTPTGFKGSFKLSYKRFGEQITTPASTPPTSTLPPPVEDAQTEIIVYLGGLTPVEFGNKEEEFRTAVANMAIKYCAKKGITLVENPTSGNVVLSLITQCNINWPYSDVCVHTNMSVTVITPESSNPEHYELTVPHLQEMWDTLAPSDPSLKKMGVHVYEIPDPDTELYIWLGVSLGILLLFLAFLVFVYRFNIFQEYSRMRDRRNSAFSNKSSVTSNDSWFPTTHQQIPPFLHSDTTYIDYEPAPSPKPAPSAPAPLPNYGPPPSYGPPQGYGGAIRFFANRQTNRDFANLAFEEEEEEEYRVKSTPTKLTKESRTLSADC